jgi:hypothetical protein
MKTSKIFIMVLMAVFIFKGAVLAQKNTKGKDDFPVLKGPYLGQKPPGLTPELFAEGIISTELHDDAAPAFTLDGKEVYFRIVYKIKGEYFGTIFFMRELNGQWSYPKVAPFSGKYMDGGVTFSNDWKKLYFTSAKRSDKNISRDLWEVKRAGDSWAEPVRLDTLNTENDEMFPCENFEKMLYWIVKSKQDNRKLEIFRSKIANNKWGKKEKVKLFTDQARLVCLNDFSPDNSFILLTMWEPGKDIDIFISFKKYEGAWGDPINLGPNINSNFMDKCPMLSPDGKYLFFVSSRPNQNQNPQKKWHSPLFDGHEKIFRADIYWVSAKFIEALKPKNLK